jgi:hypothetical protein
MSLTHTLSVKLKNIHHLVFSGGGLLGISYIGLFKYLEEQNVLHQIATVTGCSAGSIFCTFFMLGYTSSEMEIFMKSLNFKDYLTINANSIIKFPKTKGLEAGHKMTDIIKKIIKDKTGDENITFAQSYNKYKIVLQIGVTNLTTMNFEIFNYITKPDLAICTAIRASISIPIIFEPVIIDNAVYCDGGVVDNMPIESAIDIARKIYNDSKTADSKTADIPDSLNDTKYLDSILSVFLMSKYQPISPENIATITLQHFIDVITQAINNGHVINNFRTKFAANTLIIEIPVDIMTFIKLNASTEDIDNIIDIAYNTSATLLNA